jgi:AraC-like DNA-binding protein
MHDDHKRVSQRVLAEYERVKDEAVKFIEKNFWSKHCTIMNFCKHTAYSKRSVQRALSAFGLTWKKLVKSVRAQKGAELLEKTDKPIGWIAERCSYLQPKQFTKAFGEHYGMSPTQYRKKAKEHL